MTPRDQVEGLVVRKACLGALAKGAPFDAVALEQAVKNRARPRCTSYR